MFTPRCYAFARMSISRDGETYRFILANGIREFVFLQWTNFGRTKANIGIPFIWIRPFQRNIFILGIKINLQYDFLFFFAEPCCDLDEGGEISFDFCSPLFLFRFEDLPLVNLDEETSSSSSSSSSSISSPLWTGLAVGDRRARMIREFFQLHSWGPRKWI